MGILIGCPGVDGRRLTASLAHDRPAAAGDAEAGHDCRYHDIRPHWKSMTATPALAINAAKPAAPKHAELSQQSAMNRLDQPGQTFIVRPVVATGSSHVGN